MRAGLDGGECCAKPWLNLNLSHHGAWVVLAWEEQHLVGADVMTTSQPRPSTPRRSARSCLRRCAARSGPR
mgnify:CR=1 FL=1|jgi:phosphopantetheinyl transferase